MFFPNKIFICLLLLTAISYTPQAVLAQNSTGGEDPVAIYKEAGINGEQESNIRKLTKISIKKQLSK